MPVSPGKGILDRGGQGGSVTGEHFTGAGRAGPEVAEPENGHYYPSCLCMSGSPHATNASRGWASPEGAHAGGILRRDAGHDGAAWGRAMPWPARASPPAASSRKWLAEASTTSVVAGQVEPGQVAPPAVGSGDDG